MDDWEAPELISIGIVTALPADNHKWMAPALRDFQRMVIRERSAFRNKGLRLNIVFNVPSPVLRSDFEGVVATRLSKKNARLLVRAAVPDDLSPGSVGSYAAEVLQLALAEARVYVASKRLTYDMSQLQDLVAHLVRRLTTN
jgi:hypothetical protein